MIGEIGVGSIACLATVVDGELSDEFVCVSGGGERLVIK